MESTPLSFQQQFHWDNAQRLSDLNLNFPFALLLTGALDIERLREKFRAGRPTSRGATNADRGRSTASPDKSWTLRVTFGSRWCPGPSDVTSEVEVYLNSPFNLVGGRLLRARLLRLSNRQHILLVCAHHLIMDAFSVRVLANELWHCYATRSPRLPTLPIQYADYGRQQRATHGHWLECHGTYWSERLATAVPLRLPVSGPSLSIP